MKAPIIIFFLLIALIIGANATSVTLTAPCSVKWKPQADATGFRVWRGIELLAVVTEPRAVVQLPIDQLSSITITAFNDGGESEHSDPLPVMPVTPHSSDGLQVWTTHRTFFVRVTPSKFFRFTYPTH